MSGIPGYCMVCGAPEGLHYNSCSTLPTQDEAEMTDPTQCPKCTDRFPCDHQVEALKAMDRGIKYDDAKAMMDLIPPNIELQVADVLTFGAKKYAPDNWRKVMAGQDGRRRYIAAALRHINAIRQGEQLDPESGKHHAAHAICCLMFLREADLEGVQ